MDLRGHSSQNWRSLLSCLLLYINLCILVSNSCHRTIHVNINLSIKCYMCVLKAQFIFGTMSHVTHIFRVQPKTLVTWFSTSLHPQTTPAYLNHRVLFLEISCWLLYLAWKCLALSTQPYHLFIGPFTGHKCSEITELYSSFFNSFSPITEGVCTSVWTWGWNVNYAGAGHCTHDALIALPCPVGFSAKM